MHPAPPAAFRLARRLRQLRESWPRLTQNKLDFNGPGVVLYQRAPDIA